MVSSKLTTINVIFQMPIPLKWKNSIFDHEFKHNFFSNEECNVKHVLKTQDVSSELSNKKKKTTFDLTFLNYFSIKISFNYLVYFFT
jgi:hypothetical protein